MRRRLAGVALCALAAAGCAVWPFRSEPAALLAQADRLAERGEYGRAVQTYDAYLARYPDDPEASRALASRDAVAGLLAARAEVSRLQSEVARLRDEVARLRADLERIKEQDLKLERKR